MILSRNLSEAFSAQANAEAWSPNLYLSMSVYFRKAGLNGFVHWMEKQAAEELEHTHKLIDHILSHGGDITIGQINVVPTGWGNLLEVFEHVYKRECYVSGLIDKLVDIAEADKDHASRDFLFWFAYEQVREEPTTKKAVDQLKSHEKCHYAIIDYRLGKR